jgi:hypothetical protein
MRIAIATIVMMSLPMFATDEPASIGALVRHSLDWRARWYDHQADSCVTRTPTAAAGYALIRSQDILVGYSCKTRSPIRQQGQVFEAVVPQAALMFNGTLTAVPRADLSDLEISGCKFTEDDLQQRSLMLRQKGQPIRVPPPGKRHEATPSRDLVDYASRTLAAWRSINGRSEAKKILVGRVAEGDPYLVVAAAEDEVAWLIPIPESRFLGNPDYCGPVFSSAAPDGRGRPARHLSVSQLKDR